MNLIGSCNTVLSIVYFKAQDRGSTFIAVKIHKTETESREKMEFHSRLLCCISKLVT